MDLERGSLRGRGSRAARGIEIPESTPLSVIGGVIRSLGSREGEFEGERVEGGRGGLRFRKARLQRD